MSTRFRVKKWWPRGLQLQTISRSGTSSYTNSIDYIDTLDEPLVGSVGPTISANHKPDLYLWTYQIPLFQLSVLGEESTFSYREDDLKCDADPMAPSKMRDKELLDLVDKEDLLVGSERRSRSLSHMYRVDVPSDPY